MKSSAKKVELASVDDLFSTEESRADAQRERVLEIPLSELHPFKNHPFKVKDDESMMETADSVRQYGVLVPAIARPDPEGGYELVAGHRRHRASELAEKETMPVIVRDLDDDAATIIMVDSNLQRESLLPSERAFAYKMKLEAIKHQGARTDLTSRQVVGKLEMADVVGEKAGDSGRQVQRYGVLPTPCGASRFTTHLCTELSTFTHGRRLPYEADYFTRHCPPEYPPAPCPLAAGTGRRAHRPGAGGPCLPGMR